MPLFNRGLSGLINTQSQEITTPTGPQYIEFSTLDRNTNPAQQTNGNWTVDTPPNEIIMFGNVWHTFTMPTLVTVTATNTITWDFASITNGEIQAFGVMPVGTIDNPNPILSTTFRHRGTQGIGSITYKEPNDPAILHSGSEYKTTTILLSDYWAIGTVLEKIAVINDKDANPKDNECRFRNIFFTD